MPIGSLNGKWVDTVTGAPATDAQMVENGMSGFGGQQGNIATPNPFNPDYMATHRSQFKENPFQAGTNENAEFQKSQIKGAVDNASQPDSPGFTSLINKDTGLLNDNLQAKSYGIGQGVLDNAQSAYDKVQLNKDPLHALENEGMRTGPSAWANLMNKGIDDKKTASLDTVNAQAQGANAGAQSSLAMRGGLNSGARTSLAKDMQRGINADSQGVRRGAEQDSLNVGIADEGNRLNILGQLPGQELAAMQPEMNKATAMNAANLSAAQFNASQDTNANKTNVQNSLNETLQQRGYDVNNYNQLMSAWGAGKTADATGSGGKK